MIQAISLGGLWLVLLLGALASTEIGLYLGRRSRRPDFEDKDANGLAAAALGLFALLIAFTYSLSVTRYEARRDSVLAEANAIGSTANFALMLPLAEQAPILNLLRDYTQVRVSLGVPFSTAKFARDVDTSSRLQAELWRHAVAVTAAAPQSLPAYRFVASLNETNNVGEARITKLRNHVPVVVVLVLVAVSFVAMGFSGYGAGVSGVNRRVAFTIMSVTLSLLITLTIDLDRPDRGTIEVSTQPLIDALNGLPKPILDHAVRPAAEASNQARGQTPATSKP